MFEYDANGYPQQFFTSTPNGTNGNTYFPPPGIQVNFDASALSHMYPQQGTNVHAYQQCVPHQADGSIPTTATSIYHPMSTPLGYGTNRQSLSPIVSYANNVNVAQEQSNNDSAAFSQPQTRKRSLQEDSSSGTSGYLSGNSPISLLSASSLINNIVKSEYGPPPRKRPAFEENKVIFASVPTDSLDKPAVPQVPQPHVQDERVFAQKLNPPSYLALPVSEPLTLLYRSQYDIEKNVDFNDAAVYADVPGRLTLLNTNTKYKMSVGEIYRRITPPEFLNASFLGGILRMAKNRNGGSELRERLRDVGIGLPAGRRKSRQCSTFTPLTEGEARQMAVDYSEVMEAEFPTELLGKLSFAALDNKGVEEACNALKMAEDLMNEVMCFMSSGDISSYDSRNGHYFCHADQQQTFDKFVRINRLTHGNGNLTTIAAWISAQRLFRHLRETIKSRNSTSGGVHPMLPFLSKPNQALPMVISAKTFNSL